MLLVVKNRNIFLNSLWLVGWGRLLLTGGAFSATLYAGEPVRFSEHLLADENTYTFGLAAVDVDGDGDLDLTYPDIYAFRTSRFEQPLNMFLSGPVSQDSDPVLHPGYSEAAFC